MNCITLLYTCSNITHTGTTTIAKIAIMLSCTSNQNAAYIQCKITLKSSTWVEHLRIVKDRAFWLSYNVSRQRASVKRHDNENPSENLDYTGKQSINEYTQDFRMETLSSLTHALS